jgi:hypothetical protein
MAKKSLKPSPYLYPAPVLLISPIAYCPKVNEYRALGATIGTYGFSKKGQG